MRKLENKKSIVSLILFVWVIFSVSYIVYDVFQDFKNGQLQAAYQKGAGDAITTLINETSKCSSVPLYSGDKSTEVVSLDCLKTQNQDTQAQE